MTRDDKINRLDDYCNVKGNCLGCVLNTEKFCDTHSWQSMSDELLDECLELIDDKEAIEKDNEVDDPINPKHYKDGKIEVIDFIEDKKLGYCLGNAVKYIARAGKKDPTKEVEDLKKAEWYVNRRIKELEEVI